ACGAVVQLGIVVDIIEALEPEVAGLRRMEEESRVASHGQSPIANPMGAQRTSIESARVRRPGISDYAAIGRLTGGGTRHSRVGSTTRNKHQGDDRHLHGSTLYTVALASKAGLVRSCQRLVGAVCEVSICQLSASE